MVIKSNKKNPMAKDLFKKGREVLNERKVKFKALLQFVGLP